MLGAALGAALQPVRIAARVGLWTVTAPNRVLQAVILHLSPTQQRRLDDVFQYGPRRHADGSIERYDDGLVIIAGTQAAEIPSRMWVQLAGDSPEREEEQFDPMEKLVHEIERYRSAAAAHVAPDSEPARAAGEQAVADVMTLGAAGLVGSNIKVRDEPALATGASRPDSGMLETTTQTIASSEDGDAVGNDENVISLIVKKDDLLSEGIAHRDVIRHGGGVVREDENEDVYEDTAKRVTLERDPKPELSLVNLAALANDASQNFAHEDGSHVVESPFPEYPAAQMITLTPPSSCRGSTRPPSYSAFPSPAWSASGGDSVPPLVWSERIQGVALAKQQLPKGSHSPMPSATTPFNDDGLDWMTRDGSYFPAELHRTTSMPISASAASDEVEERDDHARAIQVPPMTPPL